jgi:DNA-binding NtrC family response regulator
MAQPSRVLVVDDDPMVQQGCRRILGDKHALAMTATGRQGLEALEAGSFDLALVDLKLPDLSGLDILRRAPDAFPDTPIIIMTGYSTIRSAVEAIKMGAFDYLAKPFGPAELEAAVEKALREHRLLKDYHYLQEVLADRSRAAHLVAESPAMRRVLAMIEQVAATDSTILLTGESGTGKELVARAIHLASARRQARFVAVDCGAIDPHLIASELFGHVRGAFTGAVADHTGLIQAGDGGTVFLDEVSNLPLDLQASLLRVIETHEVRAVGTSEAVRVNVRYVAATNRDLRELIAEGRFREDLYYRLNVFPIHLPPLRERRDEVPVLARHFLALYSARMHKRVEDFTAEALEALKQYEWPGNVRELSNVVERLVILSDGDRIGLAHLRDSMWVSPTAAAMPQTFEEFLELKRRLRERAIGEAEKAFLLEALRRSGFNATRAAALVGIQRPNFQALLKKYNLRLRDLMSQGQ